MRIIPRNRSVKSTLLNCFIDIKGLFYDINHNPILVFGNPKSGTTIIAYLIAKALRKSYTADLIRAIPDASLAFQLEYDLLTIDAIVKKYRIEFSKGVIKEPVLSNYAAKFTDYFEDCYPVFIFRDPRENIRSILNRLKIPGHLEKIEFDEYPELLRTPAWKLALTDEWKKNSSANSYIEVMANNWACSFKQYLSHSSQFYLLRYEDFVMDKSGEIEQLCIKMGFDIKCDISPYVDKQMQSRGNSNTNLLEFFGAKNLASIERICGEGMNFLHYESLLN